MKKLFSAILAVAMLCTFAACGEKAAPFTRGTWNENVFTSEFAGFSFENPEEWVMATDEEMAQIFEVTVDEILAKSDLKADSSTYYDMLVQDPYTGTNISMIYEDLSKSIGGKNLDEKGYYEIAAKQFEGLDGMEVVKSGEMQEYKVGENTYFYQDQNIIVQGEEIPQTLVLRKFNKNFMLVATFTRLNGETSQDLLALFS